MITLHSLQSYSALFKFEWHVFCSIMLCIDFELEKYPAKISGTFSWDCSSPSAARPFSPEHISAQPPMCYLFWGCTPFRKAFYHTPSPFSTLFSNHFHSSVYRCSGQHLCILGIVYYIFRSQHRLTAKTARIVIQKREHCRSNALSRSFFHVSQVHGLSTWYL